MTQPSLLDRRRFLLGAAPAFTITTPGVGACSKSNGHADPPPYTPTYFSAAEWALINAAVDRLIPAEGAGPGGVQPSVPEFIDRQMELPYGHGAYFYGSRARDKIVRYVLANRATTPVINRGSPKCYRPARANGLGNTYATYRP